jgi:hypothetical protein
MVLALHGGFGVRWRLQRLRLPSSKSDDDDSDAWNIDLSLQDDTLDLSLACSVAV